MPVLQSENNCREAVETADRSFKPNYYSERFQILERAPPKDFDNVADLVDKFDIKSGWCALFLFDPKKKVFRAIEEAGRSQGANIAVIDTTSYTGIFPFDSYQAVGKFYKVKPGE